MKQRKQNYITLTVDGEVLSCGGVQAAPELEPAPAAADVAYRLSRAAGEAAAALPLAPNAIDSADMSESVSYTHLDVYKRQR